ncbi:hypothetical protein ACROYT_G042618 [Oculina patagonica]
MADSYKQVKVGRLKLKGLGESSHKKKHKKKKREREEEEPTDVDVLRHGGWRKVENFHEVSGNIALQTFRKSYVEALNTGMFTVGELRDDGENSPAPVEVFTAVPLSEKKIALKSGYGKYMSVNMMGNVTGRSEAIGPQEQFECVFEEDKVALETYNGCFLSVNEDGQLSATKKIVSEKETFHIRTSVPKVKVSTSTQPEGEKDLRNHEISFVKKFQSFQDRNLRLSEQETSKLKKARMEGKLHEEMLDRREKMKADRYCK